MERFAGFYTSDPFWACEKIDFPYNAWIHPHKFYDIMTKVAYEKSTNEATLRVDRDGLILLRISSIAEEERQYHTENRVNIDESVARAKTYTNYLNCFCLFLDSAAITVDQRAFFNYREVTTHEMLRMSFKDGKFASAGLPNTGITANLFSGRHLSDYEVQHSLDLDKRISDRFVVSFNAIDYAANQLFSVFSKEGSINHFTSVAKSISEYKVGNYDTSIILAWFVIESIVNSLWKSHLESLDTEISAGRSRINRVRYDDLTGSSFEAGKTIQMLELFGVITFDTYETLTKVRKNRNNIAHVTKIVLTAEKASEAISAARAMISLKWGIDFTPNLNYNVLG